MTPTVLMAAVAGVVAAVALSELAALRAGRVGKRSRSALPATLVGLLARLGAPLGAPPAPAPLAWRLQAAGSPLGLAPADVAAVKAAAALAGPLACLPLAALLPARPGVAALLAAAPAAYFAPDLLLARLARARARSMDLELPDALDLLRVAVEAGLSPARALGEVGRRHTGLVAAEWGRAAAQLALGVPTASALASLQARCPAAGMPALVAALSRAGRSGTPLGETLLAQATEARSARARELAERAARAAPKIQLVVALLLVPSVLLLVAAALMTSLRPG